MNNRAVREQQAENFNDAVDSYEEALHLLKIIGFDETPDAIQIHFRRMEALYNANRFSHAVSESDEIVNIHDKKKEWRWSDYPRILLLRGQSRLQLDVSDQYPLAEAEFKEAIAILNQRGEGMNVDPAGVVVFHLALALHFQEKNAEAVAAYRKAKNILSGSRDPRAREMIRKCDYGIQVLSY